MQFMRLILLNKKMGVHEGEFFKLLLYNCVLLIKAIVRCYFYAF